MRARCAVVLACVVLAGSGCGGNVFGNEPGVDGGDGGGSSSGSSSGGGSGGGSSGSSSGGGAVCPPTPGEGVCSAGEQCTYGSGCGETSCSCDSAGEWVCAVSDCPAPECPPSPGDDLACPLPGQTCGYPTGGGCGEDCTCEAIGDGGSGTYAWSCSYAPCPPPSCPTAQPQNGDACMPVDDSCDYVSAGCFVQCDCVAPGAWSCFVGTCMDAGSPPEDAGASDH